MDWSRLVWSGLVLLCWCCVGVHWESRGERPTRKRSDRSLFDRLMDGVSGSSHGIQVKTLLASNAGCCQRWTPGSHNPHQPFIPLQHSLSGEHRHSRVSTPSPLSQALPFNGTHPLHTFVSVPRNVLRYPLRRTLLVLRALYPTVLNPTHLNPLPNFVSFPFVPFRFVSFRSVSPSLPVPLPPVPHTLTPSRPPNPPPSSHRPETPRSSRSKRGTEPSTPPR